MVSSHVMSQDVSSLEIQDSLPILQTIDIKKSYRTGFWMNKVITPLKSCSITVQAGETFGLLGPNGAGKTTLLKILLGIIEPSAGKGMMLGKPLGDRSVKQSVGYLPENAYFYDYLTGWEFLEFVGTLFQIPKATRTKRIKELLDLVGLDHKAAKKKQMRQYSKGMLQRIGVAQTLINDPKIVFLDEPMSGLDPLGRSQVRDIILSLKEQEFVQAAKAMGAKPFYIILRHILPQTATYIIISATLAIPSFIITESVLSLIGLGIQQPDPSWGNLLSLATNASILVLQPWLIWPPALLIILTVLAFNVLGDGLRDVLDPRSLQKR